MLIVILRYAWYHEMSFYFFFILYTLRLENSTGLGKRQNHTGVIITFLIFERNMTNKMKCGVYVTLKMIYK